MRYKLLLFVLVISANQLIIAQSRPNIIFILADDLGYADLSCYGRKDYQTPHLDKLASEGIKFHNAYAGSALCHAQPRVINDGSLSCPNSRWSVGHGLAG